MKFVRNTFFLLVVGGLGLYLFFYFTQETQTLTPAIAQQSGGRVVQLSAGFTHYELSGADTAQTIVLIGGGASGYFDFDKNVDALTQAGFRVLRYDSYGRGLSERVQGDYDLKLFETQFLDLLKTLKIRKPIILAGFSMGGMLAIDFTHKHPDFVDKLILIDPAATNPPPAWYLKTPVVSDMLMTIYWYPRTIKRQLSQFYKPENVAEYADKLRPQMQYKGYKRAVLSSWVNTLYQSMEKQIEIIGKHPRKVLLIWGENDPLVQVSGAEMYLKAMPNATLATIAEAGHCSIYERPDLANPVWVSFLKR